LITRLLLIFRFVVLLAAGMAAPAGAQSPIVVGAVVSETGPHAELASGYRNGLLLWQEELNAAGGLLGRKVELRLLDDGSEAVRAGALYVQLIREDKTDLLIGPYGSAATIMGGAEAESARRVFINGAGPSRAVHKRSPRYVFQTAVPYNAYGAPVLEIAKAQGHKAVVIVARDDPAAREMGEAAKEAALKQGVATGDLEVHRGGASDFTPQLLKAKAAGADAWIAFGEGRDAAEMVKSLKKNGYAPRLFFASGASDPALMEMIGQDAEYALGARAYDARSAAPANQAFVKAFTARFSFRPGPSAAEGYAAGTVLAEGVRRAGTLDQEKLRAALASLAMQTVFGEHKVDPLTGEQVAARPLVTQIQKGRVELVWPRALATAELVLPYPAWSERKVIRKR
jgi:branched-chain amino acid transport system substrate-binding protein